MQIPSKDFLELRDYREGFDLCLSEGWVIACPYTGRWYLDERKLYAVHAFIEEVTDGFEDVPINHDRFINWLFMRRGRNERMERYWRNYQKKRFKTA